MTNQACYKGAFYKEGALCFKKWCFSMLAIFLVIANIGCTHKNENKVVLKPGKEIRIALPFQPYRTWLGWTDSIHGKSGAFYFADLTTYKKIFFTNGAGEIIDSIPLTVAPRWNDRLKGLLVYNRDTVLAASEYSNNHLYYFNHDGYVFRDVNLPVRFHDTLYEAIGGGMERSTEGDRLFLENNLIENPAFADTMLTESEYLKRYDKVWNSMPVTLLYEGARTQNPKITFIGTGLRARFTPEGSFSLGSEVDCATGDAYYYATANADSIYKFSLGTAPALVKVAPVHSSFAITRTLPYKRDGRPIDGQTTTNREASYRCMKYDKYRRYIYLTAFYPAPKNAPPLEAGEHRKWSLFIYDEALTKLAEIPFERDTYDPNDFIVSPKGLLLRKTDHENAQKSTFTLFEVLVN